MPHNLDVEHITVDEYISTNEVDCIHYSVIRSLGAMKILHDKEPTSKEKERILEQMTNIAECSYSTPRCDICVIPESR